MATLNELLDHPLTKPVDISKVEMKKAVVVLRAEFGDDPFKGNHEHPEVDALDFYLSNHVVGLLQAKNTDAKKLTRMEQSLVERYVKRQTLSALRAFSYLLLICTREMRHCKGSTLSKCKITNEEKPFYDFLRSDLKKSGESNIANQIWDGTMSMELGGWTSVLEKLFRHGSWSGGYGGKAWAEVTLCLREYVHGVYTAEMMIDTIWTLCHNNGPIFNKGMIYKHHGHELLRILDVQRAGQIPNFFWGETASGWYKDYLADAADVFPELLEDANIQAIKSTAVHPALWKGSQYATPGLHSVKPQTHGQNAINVTKVGAVR